MTKTPWTVFYLTLSVSACDTRQTASVVDARAANDSGAAGDQTPSAEVAPELAPDVISATDAAFLAETTAPDAKADFSSSDAAMAMKDVLADLSERDTATADASTVADTAGQDLARDLPASDGASDVWVSSTDGASSTFCSGALPRMVVNGISSNPAVDQKITFYDCCDGGEFEAITETFLYPVYVPWRVQAGSTPTYPATIDLANPPSKWSVQVTIGCDPLSGACLPAPDSYTTGLSGTMQVSLVNGIWDTSLCLHVEESGSSPHPIVHSLDLYAPHISPI